MKYLITLALVSLAYADPIYYSTEGVAQLPAAARVAPYWLADAYATPAAAATPGLPVDIASKDILNLNAAAKGLAVDQASIGAPSGYAPAIQALTPAATRVYTTAGLSSLDAAALGVTAAIEAVDGLTGAAKIIAINQANVGAASSHVPYLKSVMADAPVTVPLAPANAMTKFAPSATRVIAPAGMSVAHGIHALSPAAAATNYGPAATRAGASTPTVYLSDSGAYKVKYLPHIAEVLSH
ncbi:hypothetical protein J6590_000908 [Homalodisca vitripennis]|nr:hypothetical protein J6590_000908 [Homalodisca vitripennis]